MQLFLGFSRRKEDKLNSLFGLVMEEQLVFHFPKDDPSCHSLFATFRGLGKVSESS
jgi:hypothetical protein